MPKKLNIIEEDYLIWLARKRIMVTAWMENVIDGHRTLKSLISKSLIECKDLNAISKGVRFTDKGNKVVDKLISERQKIRNSIEKEKLSKNISGEMLIKCPSCSGNAGYRYSIKCEVEGAWGESAHYTGTSMQPITCTCLECGKRVDLSRSSKGILE